jgi:hypothetical protein
MVTHRSNSLRSVCRSPITVRGMKVSFSITPEPTL